MSNMIKRTAERVLAWIGVGIEFFTLLFLAFYLVVMLVSPSSVKEGMTEDGTISSSDANSIIGMVQGVSGIWFIVSLIGFALAMFAAIKIGKKTKMSGIILTILGVIFLFFSFAGIFWLISGIMLLVRKPKQSIYDSNGYSNDHYQNSTHNNNNLNQNRNNDYNPNHNNSYDNNNNNDFNRNNQGNQRNEFNQNNDQNRDFERKNNERRDFEQDHHERRDFDQNNHRQSDAQSNDSFAQDKSDYDKKVDDDPYKY